MNTTPDPCVRKLCCVNMCIGAKSCEISIKTCSDSEQFAQAIVHFKSTKFVGILINSRNIVLKQSVHKTND